jgi:DNA polymerase-3 subunit delta
MPTLTPRELHAEVRSGRIGPLYLLVGGAVYLRDKALRLLVDAAVDPAVRAFNLDVFRGDEVPAGEIADRILSFPMMASRRAVVVKGCEAVPDATSRSLLPLIESPPETTTLIFVADKADGRKRLFAALQKAARVVDFKPMKERELALWVQERMEESGKRLSPEALRLFCERAGTDLGVVAGEVDKLVLLVGDRGTVEREDVERAVGVSEESGIFDLTDAVGAKDAGRALGVLRQLLDAGERGGGILWRLTQHIHTLMKVRMLRESRVPDQDLPGRLGLSPYIASKYVTQARNFTVSDLWRAYESLVTAEDHLKSGYQTEGIVLRLLVRALCR